MGGSTRIWLPCAGAALRLTPDFERLLPMRRRRALLAGVVALLLLAVALPPTLRHLRAAGVLLEVVQLEDPTGLTGLVSTEVEESEGSLRVGDRTLRFLRYRPEGRASPPVALLLHGVHPEGIDERRLRAFARAVAGAGVEVVTPELPELARYEIVPSTLEDIRACAHAFAPPDGGRIGAFGISFAGGLLLMAAANGSQPAPLDYVVAVGAHHSLERLSRFYAGKPVKGPGGRSAPGNPHPYGARVIAYAHAEHFFSPADVAIARQAMQHYLGQRYRQARATLESLSPAGRERMAMMLDNDRKGELGKLLLSAVARNREALAEVSPEGQLAGLRVPTFLVHGAADPVIPSIETRWLATEVPSGQLRETLITPVLGHTDFTNTLPLSDYWRILRVMAGILGEAED